MARKNTPSHKRSASPAAFRLTERDRQVVHSVDTHRILTTQQIEVLHFASNSAKTRTRRAVCQRRTQGLFHHGFLDRIQRPVILGEGRHAFAYALDRRGADLVAQSRDVDRAVIGWKPKDNRLGPIFLEHLIHINDVRVVTQLLAKSGAFAKVEWIDELALKAPEYQDKMPTYQRSGRATRIFPDGFCAIWTGEHKQPASFFLEVDQGTMQNSLWANKIEAYRAFRDSGLVTSVFRDQTFSGVGSCELRASSAKPQAHHREGRRHTVCVVHNCRPNRHLASGYLSDGHLASRR